MAIFGVLQLETVVQTNDKTRLDATKSFPSKEHAAITLVRIKPSAADSFITVNGTGTTTKDWFIDWQYSSAGTKTVTLEITAGAVETFTQTISVVTSADDLLFSNDAALTGYEPDILKWVRPGRNSFLDVHRAAQSLILDWLDSIRLWNRDGGKLTKADLSLTDDLTQLSTYWTLMLIFRGLSNKTDDVFAKKASDYESKVMEAKNRGRIQADLNGDAEIDATEGEDQRSYFMVRR